MPVAERDKVEQRVTAQNDSPMGNRAPEERPLRHWWIAAVAFAIVAAVVIAGIVPRVRARATLRSETNQLAVPAVSLVQPKRASTGQEILLPANVQAFKDAPIYARTNGYLRKWYFDIGGRVKAGQLLADIDTPEVEQQLRQARADLATAEANAPLGDVEAMMFAAVTDHLFIDEGHTLDFTNKAFEALNLVGASAAASVIERQVEIGLMKALGAGRATVGFLLAAEQLLLALLGGGTGYLLGLLLARLVGSKIFGTPPAPSLLVLGVVLALAAVVTLAGSALPLKRAANYNPAPILRGE